eukprot:TRINITY_DN7157_c0_g3_i1.p1 TRINITY_DN7157_c0_g3~~TRINITY_DN7157_c0_g3_i1.p1  ORF type:complete len:238 (-),score=-5.70 TRINITY_DN7157_c0_g3_i1:685-1398(-)
MCNKFMGGGIMCQQILQYHFDYKFIQSTYFSNHFNLNQITNGLIQPQIGADVTNVCIQSQAITFCHISKRKISDHQFLETYTLKTKLKLKILKGSSVLLSEFFKTQRNSFQKMNPFINTKILSKNYTPVKKFANQKKKYCLYHQITIQIKKKTTSTFSLPREKSKKVTLMKQNKSYRKYQKNSIICHQKSITLREVRSILLLQYQLCYDQTPLQKQCFSIDKKTYQQIQRFQINIGN